jgi:6-phosphogluconolactonase (cycloisomerase 2 family)
MQKWRAVCLLTLTAFVAATMAGCGSGSTSSLFHTPKFLVALDDSGSGTNVNVYSINATTGALTNVSATSPQDLGVTYPIGITVHPNGHWLYVGDSSDGSVHSWAIDASGKLTETSNVTTGSSSLADWPNSLAVTPNGKYLYSADDASTITAYSISQSDGSLTVIGSLDLSSAGAANSVETAGITATNNYVYSGDWDNPVVWETKIGSDGSLSLINSATVPTSNSWTWLAQVDRSGQYVVVGDEGPPTYLYVYKIASDGSLAAVGSPLQITNPFSQSGTNFYYNDMDTDAVSFSIDNKYIYTSGDGSGVHVFGFKASTGAVSELSSSPYIPVDSNGYNLPAYGGIVVDPSNKFVYCADADVADVFGFSRDSSTGALTVLGETNTTNDSVYGVAVTW